MINDDKKILVHETIADPVSFYNDDEEEYNNQKIYAAVPVDHKHYPFTLRSASTFSPIKFDHNKYKINEPDLKLIKMKALNHDNCYQLKISDFLNHSVKIGELWQPLIDLIEQYIHFCDQQQLIVNNDLDQIYLHQKNIKNDWHTKKFILKEIYDEWIALMSKTDKIDKPIFKEARSLIFKTAKIIVPLTEHGLGNACLMNSKQPLIISWIIACVALSSIGTYIHSLLKHSKNYYSHLKYIDYKNKIGYYWNQFAQLIKTKDNHLSKEIKAVLHQTSQELQALNKENNFIKSIQKYFSKSSYQKALTIINETNEYIKLGLKLIDFKRDALKFIFV